MNTKRIKHIMLDKDIKQKDIAKAAGVSEAFISYVINGKSKPPKKLLEILSSYLGISSQEILGNECDMGYCRKEG